MKALKADFASLNAITISSEYLFVMGLEGFRLLTPSYLQSCFRFMPASFEDTSFNCSKAALVNLRRHGYRMLGNIAFTFNRLGNITLFHDFEFTLRFNDPEISNALSKIYPEDVSGNFSMLNIIIWKLFYFSLVFESDGTNLVLLLNLICNHTLYESKRHPEIFSLTIKIIQDLVSLFLSRYLFLVIGPT